ncbi:MAG: TetR/AcrR family transcriptional regulator [Eggerthellaceae bacterium]|nr:TetR/AcrR family transcriptional regulator [Eggerthellaceae bacterium]
MLKEHGSENFSVRALAKNVGLSPMGLYTYFPSRESILAAVLERFSLPLGIAPVPGEYWDETVKRITGSLLEVVQAHPQTMRINYDLRNSWARAQYKSLYLIHRDQGMPDSSYAHLYCGVTSFLAGFFNGRMQSASLLEQLEAKKREADSWEQIVLSSFTDTAYTRGIEMLLQAVRKHSAPDPCEWRTPENPEEWTWTAPTETALQ